MKKNVKTSENLPLSHFFTFLKQHGVYESFMRNCSQFPFFGVCADFDDLVPVLYVTHAFVWSETPEGGDYWRHLCNEWDIVITSSKL